MSGDGGNTPAGDGALWARALDPASNVRALGDIQRRGLRAAADVVERLVSSVDGGDGADDLPPGPASPGASSTDLQVAVELWAEIARRSLQALTGLANGAGVGSPASVPAGAITVDVGGGRGAPHARR